MNITQIMHSVWTQITSTPLFGVKLTVLGYVIGLAIQRACRGAAVINPALILTPLVACVLKATGTSYQNLLCRGEFIHFLLGPATLALAVPVDKIWNISIGVGSESYRP